MTKQTRIAINQQSNPKMMWRETVNVEQHEAMIRAAAYYHYAKRGYTPDHDPDDWLAAKAELKRWMPKSQELPLALFLRAAIEIFPHASLFGDITRSKEESV
ncbi:DUF2934 domain-containing protein [Nitrosomonas sp. Nm132]|uniref:DUF2934 domain-containing protein n=1 Tax=Nitrosomonas sp. Nm132 TaxID=1881053 RepID=UPI00088A2113|nr:DUF2934 domain-containing protein [Nitrosomonas sp. Nm132]SDH17861.1 Protein of unknown function [Nitrosomonas sp. Nm132]